MGVEKSAADGREVGVLRVVNLDQAPRVLPSTDSPAANFDNLVRANDGEWHEATEFAVLLDGVFIVLLDVIWEVVDGDAVVLNVLHD